MTSHKSPADREWKEGALCALVALGLCLYVVPQSFGAAVGVIAAGIHPWNIQGNDERRHWRVIAGWSIAAGLALAAAYALLYAPIGADAELRRFQRTGDTDTSTPGRGSLIRGRGCRSPARWR